MSTDAPNWDELYWETAAAIVGLAFINSEDNKLKGIAVGYGIVTLTEQDGVIIVSVTQLPGLSLPQKFTLNGSLESPIKVTYRQDGGVIPAPVLAYRLTCALQGRTIDPQRGMAATGLRADPEQIQTLKTGTIIEVIKDQHYFEEQDASVKAGAKLTIDYIEISGDEYSDGAEIADEDLTDIDWIKDGVWATYLTAELGLEASIGLAFSDFVIAAEQTLTAAADNQIEP